MAALTCSGVITPAEVATCWICTPVTAAAPAPSYRKTWDSESAMISSPCRALTAMPIRLPIVPLGRNTEASFPMRAAATSSSRFTVGSSPITSSPSGASIIARRISAVG